MKEEMAMALSRKYIGFLQRHRYVILLAAAMLTFLSLQAMKQMRFDNSDESFFQEGDPAVQAIERYRELFGNEDHVYVAVRDDVDVFRQPLLGTLDELAGELERKVPHIKEVTWIGNAEYMHGIGGNEIQTGPIFEEMPTDPKDIAEFKRTVLGFPDFVDRIVSRDAKTAIIVLECERYPDDVKDPRKEIAPAIYAILKDARFRHLRTCLAGQPVQDFESDRITSGQTAKLSLICLVLQSFLLFKIGRGGVVAGLRAVAAPVLVIAVSIFWTMGFVSAMGWPVSLMDIMLPTMLFSVCLGDTVHIIVNYHQHREHGLKHMDAMVTMMREVFIPCLFTSLTTMMGFLSFLTTEIVPIRMAGVYSAIGVMIAFVLAIALAPVAYLLCPEKESHFETGRPLYGRPRRNWLLAFDELLQKQVSFCLGHAKAIVLLFLLVSAASIWLYQSVVVETNTMQDISTSEKLRRDSDYFDEKLGGAMALEIMVDSGRENGARDLDFLRDVERLQRHAETMPKTAKTHSVVDTLSRVNEVLHNEDPACHVLPDEQKYVSQYLFFYETSGGKNLDKEMTLLSDVVRIHIQTRTMGTQEIKAFIREMDRSIAEELGGRLKVQYTGQMAWVAAVSDYVLSGQAMSFASALVSICLMMICCLRSVRMGIISMFPNIVPILVPMGIMGLCGINLSLVLMIFSSVIMGICVDDTIHFYVNYKHNFEKTGNTRESILLTVRSIGRPVVFTSVSLIIGFLVFTTSVVRTTGEFGVLGAVAFFCGCLADLTLSPALLYLFRPLGKDRDVAKGA